MIRSRLLIPALLCTLTAPAHASAAQPAACPGVRVPGAERTVSACLDDLTTTGTVPGGHTDPADWAGLLAPGTDAPSEVVPGIQVDGYFPDTSTTNTNHGWRHDAQFVLRLPRDWNGGLVVAGPPGTREQYANDPIIADQVLAKGYAYAATDKGNTGAAPADGKRPGASITEWHQRFTQLTRAAKATLNRHYGQAPTRTYAAGLSAGGYLVRWQLEHHPGLYTGGVDWNALIFTPDTSLLTTLPPAVRAYPAYAGGDAAAHTALLAAGYPAGSEPAWGFSHHNLWTPLLHQVRTELDPAYTGDEAAYDLATRPRSVHKALARISLTGRLTRPLVSVQGSLDTLTPPTRYAATYTRLAAEAGRSRLQRTTTVPGGPHTDGLTPLSPDFRPMLPAFTAAFTDLEEWTRCAHDQ